METDPNPLIVRAADLISPDAEAVSRLVEAYLMQTEREKAAHLGEPNTDAGLSERSRQEVEHPARAYEGASVYLAKLDAPAGVVVVQQTAGAREIKRVWVDPGARGHRVGSALIDAALSFQELPVRLTVWDWRDDAIRLYGLRGFVPVPSWEDRPQLLCMEQQPNVRPGSENLPHMPSAIML